MQFELFHFFKEYQLLFLFPLNRNLTQTSLFAHLSDMNCLKI